MDISEGREASDPPMKPQQIELMKRTRCSLYGQHPAAGINIRVKATPKPENSENAFLHRVLDRIPRLIIWSDNAPVTVREMAMREKTIALVYPLELKS